MNWSKSCKKELRRQGRSTQLQAGRLAGHEGGREEKLISEDEHYWGKDRMQELTDKYVENIDEIGKGKEEQIMEV